MTITNLAMYHIPTHFLITNKATAGTLDLAQQVRDADPFAIMMSLKASRLVEENASFGFAMAHPMSDRMRRTVWDRPYDYTAFCLYWGPDGKRYAANAIRKLRPALRTGRDTLFLSAQKRDLFREEVGSIEPDGTFAWGDYPYGGAVWLRFGGRNLLGAVSCYDEDSDCLAAAVMLGIVGRTYHRFYYPQQD